MAESRKSALGSGTHARDIRALVLELKRIEAALKKAQALAGKLRKALGATAKGRVTRHSRDL